jgi:glycosyltransferase involved in cell wall biosynthesis
LNQNVQFLHAHFADQNFIYASAISAWSGIPYGVTTHRYDIFEDPIDKATAIGLFERAAVVITISEFNRNYMVTKYGLLISKIHIVHCGVDLERFRFIEREPRQAGQALRILNIGRLVPEKAQNTLLTAMALAKERGIPFTIEIIGDGPMREELTQLAESLGLEGEVVFHGTQTETFVRERLAAVDLFVLSSRSEGLPVVLMEALAMGTPVIATRIFGIPELIENGVSGLLVPPDDPSSLAGAVCSLLADQTLLHTLPAAGRRVVEAKFDRVECTRQLVKLWSEAVLEHER